MSDEPEIIVEETNTAENAPRDESKATKALVFSIIAAVLSESCISVAGIVLAIIALNLVKTAPACGKRTAAKIIGIIALAVSIFATIAYFIAAITGAATGISAVLNNASGTITF